MEFIDRATPHYSGVIDMTAPQLRLLPAPSPADRWIAAVRREIAPGTLTFLSRTPRASAGVGVPASVGAWISALRREVPAAA